MSNNPTRSWPATLFLCACLIASFGAQARAAGGAASAGKSSIGWEAVDGAVRYDILIRNERGAVIYKETVEASKVFFSLEPGKYAINIIAINKFNKPHSESGWVDFEVAKRPPYRQVEEGTLIRVAAGWRSALPLSPWNDFVNTAPLGASLRIGITGTRGQWRYGGFETELLTVRYGGSGRASSLWPLMAGLGAYARVPLGAPRALILRAGGGMALTRLLYDDPAGGEETAAWSGKPYYGAGLALEYALPFGFFLEGGVEYRRILLADKPLGSIEGFLSSGVLFNWEAVETRRGAITQTSSAVLPVAVRLSAGVPYMMLLSDPGYIKRKTYKGIDTSLALQGMSEKLRNGGVSFDFTYAEIGGKGKAEVMSTYLSGASLLLTTDFSFPVNLLFRAGGGIAASKLEYEDPFTLKPKTVWTEDTYFTAGGGFELRVYAGIFVEALAGYYYIDQGGGVSALKLALRAGIRL
ncbi:MAG: hypothetical protein MUC76_10075 [Spirochaetes bacterium]|jgi:hypothetical protein|nr:hypothetical protein [Spirochaetota bacterium]